MQTVWLGLVICMFGLETYALGPLKRTVCTFEDSDCGWTDDAEPERYKINWDREQGSSSGGLTRDHTLGINAGRYQRIDPRESNVCCSTRFRSDHSIGRFTSPRFPPDDRYCIQFWYKLYGGNSVPIKVYAKVYGGLGYPIKTLNSGNGRQWTLAEMEIDSEYTSAYFNIVIESATVAYQYNRDWKNTDMMTVFDDVYIVNRGCREVPNCPEGFEVLESESSDIVTCIQFQSNASSWTNAVKHCRSMSPYGHLVSIDDANKERQVIRYINSNNEFRAASLNGIWTSGSDEGSEGTWYWTDEGDTRRVTYTNWRPGQPNNVGSRQDCLSLNYPQLGYQWGDEYCGLDKAYICQIHLNTTHLSSAGTIG